MKKYSPSFGKKVQTAQLNGLTFEKGARGWITGQGATLRFATETEVRHLEAVVIASSGQPKPFVGLTEDETAEFFFGDRYID